MLLFCILEKTLFTYIKFNKSIVSTAEYLHIHKNTLYQRIKKIEELLQFEFNNPNDFLQISLAYHIHESFLFPNISVITTHTFLEYIQNKLVNPF